MIIEPDPIPVRADDATEVQEPDPNVGRESALPDNGAGSGVIDVPPTMRTVMNILDRRRVIE